MFRKPKRTAKKAGLRQQQKNKEKSDNISNNIDDSKNDDDSNDGDDDDDGAGRELEQARKRVKRHKIMSSMSLTTGGGGGGRGTSATLNGDEDAEATAANNNNNNAPSSGGELSVLATKHQQNMEQYITEQIGIPGASSTTSTSKTTNDEVQSTAPSNHDTIANDEDDLYKQLAREALVRTRGDDSGTADDAVGGTTVNEDTGDGGAVLVGSGIAEVILPVHERLYANSSRNEGGGGRGGGVDAAAGASRQYHFNRKNTASSSAVPLGSRHAPLKSATPFRSMVHPAANSSTTATSTSSGPTGGSTSTTTVHNRSGEDQDIGDDTGTNRQGFAAFRGKVDDNYQKSQQHQVQHGQGPGGRGNGSGAGGGNNGTGMYRKKNRDDQMFSNFVHRHFEEKRK